MFQHWADVQQQISIVAKHNKGDYDSGNKGLYMRLALKWVSSSEYQ